MEETFVIQKEIGEQSLKELCALHPDDPTLHISFGESLMAKGREIAAITAFRKAYQILKQENPADAKKLVEKYGEEVALDSMKPMASKGYLALQNFYGRFSQRGHKVKIPESTVLFRQGEAADSVYLVLEGELAVTTEVKGKPVLLNYLYEGCLVGEGAMQEHATRSATVTSNTETLLMRFSPQDLKKAFAKHPELNLEFSKESLLRRRMATLSSSQLFSRLPMDLRFLIARRAWNISYKAGETIKEARDYMPHAALISSGVVHLYEEMDDARVYCGRLKAGAMLGLHKLLQYEASSLAYVAESNCELECIDFTVVEDVMEVSPWFHQAIRAMEKNLSDQVTRTIMLQNHDLC
jgi:CRP-like cAMP-binding protein